MQLGVVFPQHAIRPAADDFRSFAQLVEGVGYRHLLVYDHVLGGTHEDRTPPLAGPFDETSLFHETVHPVQLSCSGDEHARAGNRCAGPAPASDCAGGQTGCGRQLADGRPVPLGGRRRLEPRRV